MWIEFKPDYSCELSPDQEQFRLPCQAQAIKHHVVYRDDEAIQIVEKADAII
jgi:hypothetical protein